MEKFENIIEKFQFDPVDFLGVKYGMKTVSHIGPDGLDMKKLSQFCKESGVRMKKITQTIYGSKEKVSLLYIAKSEKAIIQLAKAEHENNKYNAGELLGYPSCCIDFFIKTNNKLKLKNPNLIQSIFKNSSEPFNHYTNTIYNNSSKGNTNLIKASTIFQGLGRYCFYYIPHHPCSFNCKKSISMGKKYKKIFMEEIPGFTKTLDAVLRKPINLFDDNHFCTFKGTKKSNALTYSNIIPELSFTEKKHRELILKGNKIIEKNNILEVYKNNTLLGEMQGRLIQFK